MGEHILKTLPQYWDAVERGEKTFEIRRDDRGFQRGDTVVLRRTYEKAYQGAEFPYRDLRFTIGWILTGGQFGLAPGHVAFSLHPAPEAPNAED